MRRQLVLVLVTAAIAATACGGATSSPPAGDDVVALQGKVVSRDGSGEALAGVAVRCPQTASTDGTDADGRFRVDVPAMGPFDLEFEDAGHPIGEERGHPGANETHHPDGVELDGPQVRCEPPEPLAWCDAEVHLDDGEVVECHVRWGHDEGEHHEGEQEMTRDPACGEVEAVGSVGIDATEDCLAVEVCIQGFSGAARLDVRLVDGAGQEAHVGTMDVDAEGQGRWTHRWCDGETLPLDVPTADDLGGCTVLVRDELGEPVFQGHVPHHHGDAALEDHGMPGGGGQHHGGGGGGMHRGP